jgi:hypothetical protein
VLAAAVITLVEVRVAVTIAHSREAVYRLPAAAVVTVVVAGAVVTVAAAALTLLPRPREAALVAVVSALALAGAATVLGVGLLLLPAAVVGGFALVPALRGVGRRDRALAVLCGIPLGAGIVAVAIVSIQPPLLRCRPGTVTEADRAWWGGLSGTWSGTDWISPGDGAGSRVTAGGDTYVYACRGSKLTAFGPA